MLRQDIMAEGSLRAISASRKIIFPFNPINKKFDSSYYDPVLTENLIEIQDISKFLREAEQQIRRFHQRALTNFFRVCFVLLLILLIATGFFVPMVRGHLDEKDVAIIAYVLFSSTFTLIVVLLYTAIKTSSNNKKNLKKAEKKIIELAKENASTFEEKGYCWVIPDQFPKWIELAKRSMQDNEDIKSQTLNILQSEQTSLQILKEPNAKGDQIDAF